MCRTLRHGAGGNYHKQGNIPVKYVHVTPEKVDKIFDHHIVGKKVAEEYTMRHEEGAVARRRMVAMCAGTACSIDVGPAVSHLVEQINKHGLGEVVTVTRSQCPGRCENGPVMHVYPDNIEYRNLTPEKIDRIVTEHFCKNKVVTSLRLKTPKFPIVSYHFSVISISSANSFGLLSVIAGNRS